MGKFQFPERVWVRQSVLSTQPLMLFSLVFVLRILFCVFRFLPAVSRLQTWRKSSASILGALKMFTWQKQYKIHVPSTIAGREKETLLRTCRQECPQQRALCPREHRHTAPCSECWQTAPPRPSWYHPNAPEFHCSRSAISLWFLLGGLDCGKRALLHLARALEQLQF